MTYFKNTTLKNILKKTKYSIILAALLPVLAFSQTPPDPNHKLAIQIEDNLSYSVANGGNIIVPSTISGWVWEHGNLIDGTKVRLRIQVSITNTTTTVSYFINEFKWFFKPEVDVFEGVVLWGVDSDGDPEHSLSLDIPCYIPSGNYSITMQIMNTPDENCTELNKVCESNGDDGDCCLIYSKGGIESFPITIGNIGDPCLHTILDYNGAICTPAVSDLALPYQQNIGTLNVSGQGFDATLSTGATNYEGYTNITVNVSPFGAYTYQWDDGSTGAVNHNVCRGKDHSVTVTNANGCSRTFTFDSELQMNLDGTFGIYKCVSQIPPVGDPGGGLDNGDVFEIIIPNVGPKNGVKPAGGIGGNKLSNGSFNIIVMPNPASSKLRINLSSVEFDNGILQLYSLDGKEAMFYEINSDEERTNIDVNSINNGIYLLKIIADGKEIHTQKVTIAH